MLLEDMIRREKKKALAEGENKMLCKLVSEGVITLETALEQTDLTREEFCKLMK